MVFYLSEEEIEIILEDLEHRAKIEKDCGSNEDEEKRLIIIEKIKDDYKLQKRAEEIYFKTKK